MTNLKEMGQRIKIRRENLNMSQQDLATLSGYTSRSSINKIELGLIDLPQSKISAIANSLNVSVSYLLWGKEKETINLAKYGIHPIEKKRFPMLGKIACGKPIFADQEFESFITASANIQADFCLTAQGDSMIGAGIHDGDVVFIKEQPIVDNGQIAAVIIEDEATLKRWYYDQEKQELTLVAENAKYPPLTYRNEELDTIYCLGRAICYTSIIK